MTGLFAINQDVVYTEVENEIVMMAPDDGAYHGLNQVGAEIWKLLAATPMQLGAIISYLKQTYALGHDEAERDAQLFVDMMLDKHFIVAVTQ